MLQAAKYIGTGLATIGLAGAELKLGIGVVFSGLITTTALNPAVQPQLSSCVRF